MNDAFAKKGKRPAVCCDAVVFALIDKKLCVLLVKRAKAPFKGMWALPGGFMEWGESCEKAVLRELYEETGLRKIKLELLGVFSAPGRDPRGTVVSIAFWGFAGIKDLRIKGRDDAAEAKWIEVKNAKKLAFDHSKILQKALKCINKTYHYHC